MSNIIKMIDDDIIIQKVENDINKEKKDNNENNNYEFITICNNLLDKITEDYKRNKEDIQKLKKMYMIDIKNAKKNKSKKDNKMNSGITKQQKVPPKLCKLLNINQNITMSRVEITKKIYDLIQQRNLYYKDDKRVFRADNDFKKVFNLPDSVNDSIDPKDKNGFNFYTLQSHIKKCYN